MALSNEDRFYLYNLAVQFCQEVLEQTGPEYYLNLFHSILNNAQFAPSFKYFTSEDAYNFFLCYPQVFTICDSIVSLSIQPLMDVQTNMNVQNNLSNFIYKIRKEQTKASDMEISQKNEKGRLHIIYINIHRNFCLDICEITEILPSIKKDLVYSIIFLLRNIESLNQKNAFKTVLYTVKNASSIFLDLLKTKKQMFVKAMCKVLNAKLPEKNGYPSNVTSFKKGVLLFATYLLIKRRKISFHIFIKMWGKLNIHKFIPKYEILKVLKTSEFIVINKKNSMSLSPSFEPVNFIVETYSKLILESSLSEDWNSNENEQDIHSPQTVGADHDVQLTDFSIKAENASNCTEALCAVQMADSQCNPAEELKSIKKEQDLSYPMRVSESDNIVGTETENQHEPTAELQMIDGKISLDEKGSKLLNSSFIIIKRYFKNALSHHIVLSFLLTFENVCENFAVLSNENQNDFIKRYCDLIITFYSSLSNSNNYELERSILIKERVLMICYLVVKFGRINYLNLIERLKEAGFCAENCEENVHMQASVPRRYSENIANFINVTKNGFLTLKKPFRRIVRSLKKTYRSFSSNCATKYVYQNNSLCFQIPSENVNKSSEMLSSSSQDSHNLYKDSPKVRVDETSIRETYSDQFGANNSLSSQSKLENKLKTVKKEKYFTSPATKSLAYSVMKTSPFKEAEIKLETLEETGIICKKFSFDENGEKLLNNSFFIIKRYFKEALTNHIVLTFLLASKNVCENFAILSNEDQFDFLERCYCLIDSYKTCDCNDHKLKSTLVRESVLIICYLVIKTGDMHYINLIKLLEKRGIWVQISEKSAFAEVKMYFQTICNYINVSVKGFLTLKPPFSRIKRCLKNKYVSVFSTNVPSYVCSDNNSLCYQIPNENKNTSTSFSRYFHNQTKDLNVLDDQTIKKEIF